MTETTRRRYRVELESVAGMFEQYDGHLVVWSESDSWADVFEAAVRELRRTAFPDRTREQWRMKGFRPVD